MRSPRIGRAVALCAVTLLAGWLRSDLGAHGLWLDEFGTLWVARGGDLAEVCRRSWSVQPGSPFFYVLVAWVSGALGESVVTLRLLAAGASCALPLAGYVALSPLGRRAAAYAAVLLAVQPLLVGQGLEARPYSLAEAFTLLALGGLIRALRDGGVWARAAAWGGGVLAVYAHYMFVVVLPVLGLVPLLVPAARRRYAFKAACLDGALAFACLLPAFESMLGLLGRRTELAWSPPSQGPLTLFASAFPGLGWVALAGVGVGLVLWWTGRLRPVRRGGPGGAALGAVLGLCLGPVALLLALDLLGSRIVAERYISAAVLGQAALIGLLLAGFPRWLGALALGVLCAGSAQQAPGGWQEWREAAQALDRLEVAAGEPVLLWQGFKEADLLLERPVPGDDLRGFLSAPLACRPGLPPDGRDYLLLPRSWLPGGDRARQAAYFEANLVPPLARAPRFTVVAHPEYERLLAGWVGRRFPDRFRETHRSRVFAAPVVVVRYGERAP